MSVTVRVVRSVRCPSAAELVRRREVLNHLWERYLAGSSRGDRVAQPAVEKGGPIMRYTYQQLEIIRERAKALGLSAEFMTCSASSDAYLSIPMPEVGDSLAYFVDFGRLASIQAWGEATAAAAEVDKLHATLTADFGEPLEPGYGRVCRGCAKALHPVGCESCGCAGRPAEEVAP